MQKVVFLLVLLLSGFSCFAAPALTLQYTTEWLEDDLFRFHYDIPNVELLANQELAIEFDPAAYSSLTNGVAPDGFDLLIFQPNDPLGAFGRFSALALIDDPDLTTGFSIDVRVLLPRGRSVEGVAINQTFAINQLDERGVLLSILAEGQVSAPTPEPASLGLIGAAMLIACTCPACRRRLRRTG